MSRITGLCKFVTLFFCLWLSFHSAAQTDVTTNIFSNTNWTKAGSPYILKNNIIIHSGATLSVNSGVQILADSGVYFDLRGTLLLNGMPDDSIILRSSMANPKQNAWRGVKFDADAVVQANCIVMNNAEWGFDFWYSYQQTKVPMKIMGSRFSDNQSAISNFSLGRPDLEIGFCLFNRNTAGIVGGQGENVKVRYCKFFDNVMGIGSALMDGDIEFCEFFRNVLGARAYFNNGGGSVYECRFYNNRIGLNLTKPSKNYVFARNRIYYNDTGMVYYGNMPWGDTLFAWQSAICDNNINIKNIDSRNVTMPYMCWCTEDSATIRSKIIDGYKVNQLGLVKYMPFMEDCQLEPLVGIRELQKKKQCTIFPNPASNTTILSCNSSADAVRVFDVSGRPMDCVILNGSELNTSCLPAGIFVVTITSDGRTETQKLIISK